MVDLIHTCAPPKGEGTPAQSMWVCPRCGSVWEAAPEGPGIFDFDRSEAVTRAVWILVEGPTLLAG
jgi:hypothetical protein